jgi:hypothetical protein
MLLVRRPALERSTMASVPRSLNTCRIGHVAKIAIETSENMPAILSLKPALLHSARTRQYYSDAVLQGG